MKHWPVYAIIVVALGLGIAAFSARGVGNTGTVASTTSMPTVTIKGNTIRVSTAVTQAEHAQGLSGRTGLAADEGMLFVFTEPGDYAFWMKDMLFSIDIVWIDAAGKIIYIAPSVSPDSYPTAFDPHMNAKYVIELPAGYMTAHNTAVGDIVQI
ncbi:MAG: hypothetical protein JWM46_71 [Candidatus Kaiserbacteria bacterium]|nr:hypothetical protein [Candidatus Kaiserbacteria bacterium]